MRSSLPKPAVALPASGLPTLRPGLLLMAGVAVTAAAIGAVQARSTTLALVLAATPAAAFVAFRLRGRMTWTAFLVALGGSMVLGYGFVNVRAAPSLPVPLVDVLLVGAFAALVLNGARWPVPRAPFVLAAMLFAWASARLLVDLPTWGTLAFRDYSTYVELSALFVGYWLMVRVGLERWIRAYAWLFVAVVVYGLVLMSGQFFTTVNFTVGVQKSVPLLGYITGVASVSAFFFFALLRPFGRLSPVLAALAIPPVFVFQSRGLYLAFPITIICLALVEAGTRSPRMRRLSAATALAVLAAGILLTIQPTGRFGNTTPSLVREQLSTLIGGGGVGSGSLNARTEWFTETIDQVRSDPGGLAFGLGLGPDLASGFSADGVVLVRKPHDDYLEIFARLGVGGIVIYLLLLLAALRPIVAGTRYAVRPGERAFYSWILANTIVYLFISATQPLLAYPFGTLPLFATLGLGLALAGPRAGTGAPADVAEAR